MGHTTRGLLRDRRFVGLLLLVIFILVVGMFFYNRVEHWRLLDSFYFSVITLTTVGYGDFTPQTDLGKMFTAVYLIFGIGIILGLVSIIAHRATRNYRKLTEAYFMRTEEYIEDIVRKALQKKDK